VKQAVDNGTGARGDGDSSALEACRSKLEGPTRSYAVRPGPEEATGETPPVIMSKPAPNNESSGVKKGSGGAAASSSNRMIMRCSYKGGQDSPTQNAEFEVGVGEIVTKLKVHEDHPQWVYVQKDNGIRGCVPSKFVVVSCG